MITGGIWRTEVGTSALYGIRDGLVIRDPGEYLIGSTPEALVGYEQFFTPEKQMCNSFSCYLFDTGSELVMIDTGFGANAFPGMDAGDMPSALEALGVSPESIDHVVFTHLHPDHILGSLDAAQQPFFPNATHWTVAREVAHWRSQTDDRSVGITRVANVLDDAGMLRAVEEPGEVINGVTQVPTYGHSPGHTAVRVSSGDASIIIAGDVTFSPVQIDYTDWAFPLDVDAQAAAETRAAFFDELAASGTPFVAGHYEHPGLGRVVESESGRKFEPIAVEQVR